MRPTSLSLLDRLEVAQPECLTGGHLRDQSSADPPLAGASQGLGDEAGDLSQEVFLVVACELPRFERRREGSSALGCEESP